MTTSKKLLTYSTRVSASVTIGQIMDIMAKNGADNITILYDPDTPQGRLSYALPCRIQSVYDILTQQRVQANQCRYPIRPGGPGHMANPQGLSGGPDGPPGDRHGGPGGDIPALHAHRRRDRAADR